MFDSVPGQLRENVDHDLSQVHRAKVMLQQGLCRFVRDAIDICL
ncbi:MAG: hypothetical protein OXG38_08365 [Chloroflexi bacterium]|nr:hypothetical protein [Chloroflexota bacterium]